MRHAHMSVVCGILMVLVSYAPATAQTGATAQINGTVKDAQGLPLPGVTVNVTKTDTGLQRTTVTDGQGNYILQSLPVGPYRLEAMLEGFRAFAQSGIVMQVGSNPTIPITLQVGELQETVTVSAAAALVETRNPGIGQVVTNQQVLELPLNGRQLQELVFQAGLATGGFVANIYWCGRETGLGRGFIRYEDYFENAGDAMIFGTTPESQVSPVPTEQLCMSLQTFGDIQM